MKEYTLSRCKAAIKKMEEGDKNYIKKDHDKNSIKCYEYLKICLFFEGSIKELSIKSNISTTVLQRIAIGEGNQTCTLSTKIRLEYLANKYEKKNN